MEAVKTQASLWTSMAWTRARYVGGRGASVWMLCARVCVRVCVTPHTRV